MYLPEEMQAEFQIPPSCQSSGKIKHVSCFSLALLFTDPQKSPSVSSIPLTFNSRTKSPLGFISFLNVLERDFSFRVSVTSGEVNRIKHFTSGVY